MRIVAEPRKIDRGPLLEPPTQGNKPLVILDGDQQSEGSLRRLGEANNMLGVVSVPIGLFEPTCRVVYFYRQRGRGNLSTPCLCKHSREDAAAPACEHAQVNAFGERASTGLSAHASNFVILND